MIIIRTVMLIVAIDLDYRQEPGLRGQVAGQVIEQRA
jgi:hypothetical protein